MTGVIERHYKGTFVLIPPTNTLDLQFPAAKPKPPKYQNTQYLLREPKRPWAYSLCPKPYTVYIPNPQNLVKPTRV